MAKKSGKTPRRQKGQRSAIEIAQRRSEVARLYLTGKQQTEIGIILGVSQATVSLDLAANVQQWIEDAKGTAGELIARELARLAKVESEVYEQWERSKQDAEIKQVRDGKDGTETTLTTKGQCGNARYMAVVVKCIEERSKLLGLLVPVSERDRGEPAEVVEVVVENADQLKRPVSAAEFEAMQERARNADGG